MAFFQEELDTCQLYSLTTGEYLCTSERMWAACTSVVDDKYTSPFTDVMASKMLTLLAYNDDYLKFDESATFGRYFEVWHKDNVVEKASCNTELPYVYLAQPAKYIQTKAACGLIDETLQIMQAMFTWASPTDVYVDKLYIDATGDTIGLSVSPTELNPDFLKDSDYARINSLFKSVPHIATDFDIYSDRQEIVLTTRMEMHALEVNIERNLNIDAITQIGDFKYTIATRNTPKDRSRYATQLLTLGLITDDQLLWILDLFDHDEQEFDVDYVFNIDGSLKDTIIKKRDARDFRVWRSETS